MPVTRKFLGFDRPALWAAADYLLTRYAAGQSSDLSRAIVVVPGSRAGRRLLEFLVEQAEQRSLVFTPPQIETVGHLPERLYPPQRPFAGDLVQQLAWAEALRRTAPATLAAVIPEPPPTDDAARWLELGDLLMRQHTELAADGHDFGDVARHGRELATFDEEPRWQALFQVQGTYLKLLDDLGLWDVQTARLVAVDKRECQTDRDVVLVGTTDLNQTQRRMLDQVAERVTALVFAPPEWTDRFDEHGCLLPAEWESVALPIATEQVQVADGPAEQADAVVRAIAAFDGQFRADEITIGVPDEQLVSYLQRRLGQWELPSRWGPGRPLADTAPYRLLAAVEVYIDGGQRFHDFAALVRHPDLYDWLQSQVSADWLTELDSYYNEHLPSRFSGEWLGDAHRSQHVRTACDAVQRLVGPLSGAERPLDQWSDPLLTLLGTVYGGRELNRFDAGDRAILVACEKLRDTLRSHHLVPTSLAPIVSAAEAIELTRKHVASENVPPPADYAAIELVGWLELPLDDAPALVVTSFNEGFVPQSLNADLFLPNALRMRLGLLDNTRRYARDAYALSVLLASCKELRLIVGRRSADDDPQVPSRLLFAADGETVARRALAFFRPPAESGAPPALPAGLTAARETSDFPIPFPQPLATPIQKLSVTSFRSYLACPYRFYLSRVLRLESLCDDADELDGAAFGNLLHAALHRFGAGPQRDSTDADEIRRVLSQELNQCVAQDYGRHPLAPVAVQVEQLRLRLDAFAAKQADWSASGWRIEHTEVPQANHEPARFDVDGQPLLLTGRIDRIDVHRDTGERVILDYKSSDAGDPPDKTHRRNDDWIDLQLPLYRHLAASLGITGPVQLGYILLPKDVTATSFELADWDEPTLESADAKARDVVRRIRRQEFWPPTEPPPDFSEEFAAICQDGVFDKWRADI